MRVAYPASATTTQNGNDIVVSGTLFSPGEPVGISLNAWCFMTPVKSISLMVGIGPQARVDHYFTQCRRCWMRDCGYRRAVA